MEMKLIKDTEEIISRLIFAKGIGERSMKNLLNPKCGSGHRLVFTEKLADVDSTFGLLLLHASKWIKYCGIFWT